MDWSDGLFFVPLLYDGYKGIKHLCCQKLRYIHFIHFGDMYIYLFIFPENRKCAIHVLQRLPVRSVWWLGVQDGARRKTSFALSAAADGKWGTGPHHQLRQPAGDIRSPPGNQTGVFRSDRWEKGKHCTVTLIDLFSYNTCSQLLFLSDKCKGHVCMFWREHVCYGSLRIAFNQHCPIFRLDLHSAQYLSSALLLKQT